MNNIEARRQHILSQEVANLRALRAKIHTAIASGDEATETRLVEQFKALLWKVRCKTSASYVAGLFA